LFALGGEISGGRKGFVLNGSATYDQELKDPGERGGIGVAKKKEKGLNVGSFRG